MYGDTDIEVKCLLVTTAICMWKSAIYLQINVGNIGVDAWNVHADVHKL